MLLGKFFGEVVDSSRRGCSGTCRRLRRSLTRRINQHLIGKDRIAKVVANLLRLGVEPPRIDRCVKTPGVERQGKIMTHPGNMVLSRSILEQRIGAGAIRTLHVFKLNDRHVSAGRWLERSGIMDGGGLRAGKPRGESAEQQ